MTKHGNTLTEQQLTSAYRALADDYAHERTAASAEQAWMLIRMRQQRARGGRIKSRVTWLALASALSVAAAGSAMVVGWSSPSLEYSLMGGTVEDRVIRTDSQPATLSFSDDSYIQAEPHTTLSVNVVGSHKAVTRLSSGKVHVQVKHSAETDWRFLAGPYDLRVIGTRFELAWDPEPERLVVVMHEGELLVSGPERTRSIRAGDRLLLEKEARAAAQAPVEDARSESELAELTALDRAEPKPAAKEQPEPSRAALAADLPGSGLTWAQMVAKGRFDEVVQAAEALGVESALSTRNATELHALAQAARYAGHTPLALRTWQAIRTRFPGKSAASQAAFFAGRTYDEQGKSGQALRWLDVYLAEAPSGVYAADALGRKLALVQKTGGAVRARAVAQDYLRRFPNGPYAKTARDVLSR